MSGKFHEFNYVIDKYDNSSALPPAKWPGRWVVLFFALRRVKSRMIGQFEIAAKSAAVRTVQYRPNCKKFHEKSSNIVDSSEDLEEIYPTSLQ